MKKVSICRNVDGMGRLVIPKEIRRFLNINESSQLNIYIEGNRICIDIVTSGCIACGKPVKERLYQQHNYLDKLCKKCINEIVLYSKELELQRDDN